MADFDLEIESRLEDDPPPAKLDKPLSGKSPIKPKRGPGRPSTKSKEKEAQDEISALLLMICMPVMMVDQVCGQAWMEQIPAISAAAGPIIAQNPKVLEWLSKGGDAVLYLKLAMAIAPPAMVTFNHHIAKPHKQEEDEYVGN